MKPRALCTGVGCEAEELETEELETEELEAEELEAEEVEAEEVEASHFGGWRRRRRGRAARKGRCEGCRRVGRSRTALLERSGVE